MEYIFKPTTRLIMKKQLFPTLLLAFLLCSASLSSSAASRTLYTDFPTFQAQLFSALTDDFETATGYPPAFEILSKASMDAVFGETGFSSTHHTVPDWNFILNWSGNQAYCAGCNGSFELDFTSTSFTVGGLGIPAVGLDIRRNTGRAYTAYVTYGDGTTENFLLPEGISYFGLTSPELIKTIHFGFPNGVTTPLGSFIIDNLTIGNKIFPPDPVPTVSEWGLIFLFLGLLTGATVFLRIRSRRAMVA